MFSLQLLLPGLVREGWVGMALYENCSSLFTPPPPPPANWTPPPPDFYRSHVAILANGHITLAVIATGVLTNVIAYLAFFSHAVPRYPHPPSLLVREKE